MHSCAAVIGRLRAACAVGRTLLWGDPPDEPKVLRFADGRVYVLLRGAPTKVDVSGPNKYLQSEAGRQHRSQVALEMLDPDVYGFMLLMLKKQSDSEAEIAFRAQTDPEWVEAFAASLANVALAL